MTIKGDRIASDGARIWGLNFRLSTVVLGEATPAIKALGIEPKELFVLDGVEDLGYPAPIAERLSMSRPTIALHLRHLEDKALITREMDQSDLRRHRLTLTPHGRTIARRARQLLSEAYDARLNRLSATERDQFAALLAALVE
jgi:DNA-binding MarR family transcriptional regulator